MKKLIFLFPLFLFGLDNILSPTQNNLFDYDEKKNEKEMFKLQNSWINPITLSHSYTRTDQYSNKKTTNITSISITQPIFKSGAIYAAIKYANFLDSYNKTSIEKAKRTAIKNAYEILFNIKKIDVSIQKQKLLIENANIDISRKKEQFLNGVIDSSYLNNAIISKNTLLQSNADLISQKESLILNFKNLSDLKYEDISLPILSLINKDNYINNNKDFILAREDIEVQRSLKNSIIGNNLVTVSLNGSYNLLKDKYDPESTSFRSQNINYYKVGFTISMPLDINSIKNIESAKISYLKSKLNLIDVKNKLSNSYKDSVITIKNIDKKIQILESTIELYKSLILSTKDNIKAGINTMLDLQELENTDKINKLTLKTYQIDKNIELLDLYYLSY
jgi:outer membrane protein TolC